MINEWVIFEKKIGFDVIRESIKRLCISEMGKERVEQIEMHTQYDMVLQLLEETHQFQEVLLFDDPFPAQDFYDMRAELAKIRLEGTFLEVDELANLRAMLQAIIGVVVYFRVKHEEEKYPRLWALCEDIFMEKELLEAINKILDPKGQLRDNASEELRRIKREIIRISAEADKKVKHLLSNAKQNGLVKEDAEMTVRNGRLCIPVPAAFKRKLPGFIHDESATGQTVFIEPTEVFDANNELKNLINAERREMIRILTEITNQVRNSIPNVKVGIQFLGHIDFIRAKALWAIETEATKPHIFDNQLINWQKAVHPLLYIALKKNQKKVQPLDISLSPEQRILIISGPNAGGKSVCLKTVGLLQYMVQCGLLVPMSSTSEMGIFDSFFIDMGDEQSIDNDLSTYSSHLSNLKVMIENLNNRSIFLIDEFGSGTEPTLGGAMAEAILETMYNSGAFGVITTHYGNLKVFSDQHPQAQNGAMLYDTHAMKPLFTLKQGKPGSSFTYEIARKIGLPEEIIASAMEKSGTAQIDYERKLEEIEIEKREIDQKLKMVNDADEKLAEMIAQYSEKFYEFEKQRKEIIQKAKNQAVSIIDSANQVIEKTIRDIKEVKADKEKTKEIRSEVTQLRSEFKKGIENAENEEALKPIVPLRKEKSKAKEENFDSKIDVGDAVFMMDMEITGEVAEINGDDVTINFNSVFFRTKMKKLTKISQREARTIKRGGNAKYNGTRIGDILNEKVAKFDPNIDVRGKRAEETLQIIEAFIDEAVLLNIHQIKILHGKGNGVLRQVIRKFLTKRSEVTSFHDEALDRGGEGITIVNL